MRFDIKNDKKNESGVYIISNLINEKCYVGSTFEMYRRFIQHKYQLNKNKHSSKYLQEFTNTYGIDKLIFSMYVFCAKEDLEKEEDYAMRHINTDFNTSKNTIRPKTISNIQKTHVSITKVIECRYVITGYENYAFGVDKKLYNMKTGREIKKTINCRSVGFWIGKQFFSLNKLRPMLKRPDHFGMPF